MTSYIRKYVTAVASAKDYIAQWSSDHVYSDEELIVPFPTLAIYDPHKHAWTVHIKAWVYVPFQAKSLTSYLPSLPSFLGGSGNNKKENEDKKVDKENVDESNNSNNENQKKKTIFNENEYMKNKKSPSKDVKVNQDKKDAAAAVSKENHKLKKDDGASDSDDDLYENALREEFGDPNESPGRLGLFFVGNSVKIATKTIINGVERLLDPSDDSGFIEQHVEIPDKELISLCTRTHEDCKDKKFEYQIQVNPKKEVEKNKKEETTDKDKKEKNTGKITKVESADKDKKEENTDEIKKEEKTDENKKKEDTDKIKKDENIGENKKEEDTDKNVEHGNDYKTFTCTVYVLARHGVSIISDIDDTIKVSNVLSKRLLLKHTFYSYFKPIEGMSDLYQKWHEQKCQFHYISASPWQLYPALRSFLDKHKFPMGTANLRKFSWNLEFFNPADTYKIETISKMIDSYPSRKYICVGDSGELDPEIYSKLYIKYPKAIAHIFIRDICHSEKCLPTCEERYTKAFEGVPKERWTIFKDPKEIETDIKKILSA
ncbi:unnamed protein product [Adineta steineri]|uniref:Phosphatidate phosphatase APP1 catalytic domain-containing protein n=1 Tax=Adineta steineri TaxID=433720 RepID=A0A819HDP6_9BILA|nr:unnamed protein product [Adineta steineri]CAF3899215.1 unnamed protein product [Adineta steineri]